MFCVCMYVCGGEKASLPYTKRKGSLEFAKLYSYHYYAYLLYGFLMSATRVVLSGQITFSSTTNKKGVGSSGHVRLSPDVVMSTYMV